MKVMIMKCSVKGAWWNKSIGKNYEVAKELYKDYLLKSKGKKNEDNHILKSDCVIMER